ncbi:hypothetical protein P8452_10095 [Trifolium repens]|nr:hypothetical protein P8452_10095 [Trifolium repens]
MEECDEISKLMNKINDLPIDTEIVDVEATREKLEKEFTKFIDLKLSFNEDTAKLMQEYQTSELISYIREYYRITLDKYDKLEIILQRLFDYLEKNQQLRQQTNIKKFRKYFQGFFCNDYR